MTATELVAWRAAHDLTLDELASVLDVNRMTLWRWEKGKYPIPRMIDLALWAIDHGARTQAIA